MKLTPEVITTLKNFCSINTNLVVKAGNRIRTKSIAGQLLGEVNFEDVTFPVDFAIYDLNEFIGVLSMFSEPELVFEEGLLTIKQGKLSVKYRYGDVETFKVVPPQNELKQPPCEINFSIEQSEFANLIRAASIMKLEEIAIVSDGEKVVAKAYDANNPLSNDFSIDLDLEADVPYTMIMAVDNLKLIPGDYDVSITSKKVAFFKNKKMSLSYVVMMNGTSVYGESA